MTPGLRQGCPTDSIQFGEVEELRARAERRASSSCRSAASQGAQLYGQDARDPAGHRRAATPSSSCCDAPRGLQPAAGSGGPHHQGAGRAGPSPASPRRECSSPRWPARCSPGAGASDDHRAHRIRCRSSPLASSGGTPTVARWIPARGLLQGEGAAQRVRMPEPHPGGDWHRPTSTPPDADLLRAPGAAGAGVDLVHSGVPLRRGHGRRGERARARRRCIAGGPTLERLENRCRGLGLGGDLLGTACSSPTSVALTGSSTCCASSGPPRR